MPVRNDNSTRLADEIRIISPWAFFIALLFFAGIIALLAFLAATDSNPPPIAVLAPIGALVGTMMAGYILLIGYVNRDAGRRGMSRVLWTLLAIFIPNALGIVLYFIFRKPRQSNCPQCGAVLQPGFGFCPQCRHALANVCQQCQRRVNAGDKFCPYCGAGLWAAGEAKAAGPEPGQHSA